MSKCTVCGKEYNKTTIYDLMCQDCLKNVQIELINSESSDKSVTNHPQRYNGNTEYECYKVLKAWLTPEQYKGFLIGNALKYQCRLGKKDDETQEIEKAEWYLHELKNCYD